MDKYSKRSIAGLWIALCCPYGTLHNNRNFCSNFRSNG